MTKRSKDRRNAVRKDWSSVSADMIADDVSWVYSTSVASQEDADWNSAWGITHLPQFARINHESFTYLERRLPMAGAAIARKYAAEVAAARHTSKLLDDTHKFLDDVVSDLRDIAERQGRQFPTPGRELSLMHYQGRLVSTFRVAEYQGVLNSNDGGDHNYSYNFAMEMGGVMVEVLTALGRPSPETVPISMPEGEAPRPTDASADSYYVRRFEPGMDQATKDVLTIIESSVNVALKLMNASEPEFPGPVFRARYVTAAHSVSSLRQLLAGVPALTAGATAVLGALDDPACALLTDPTMRSVRNCCMHYGLPGHLSGFGSRRSGYGIVEAATFGQRRHEEVDAAVVRALTLISDALANW